MEVFTCWKPDKENQFLEKSKKQHVFANLKHEKVHSHMNRRREAVNVGTSKMYGYFNNSFWW